MSQLSDYKGHRIFVTNQGLFQACPVEKGGNTGTAVAEAPTLYELKKRVDVLSKAKLNVPVLVRTTAHGDEDRWRMGRVTSRRLVDSRYGGSRPAWRVVFEEGKWEDCHVGDLVKDTAANRTAIDTIAKLRGEIEQLRGQVEGHEKALERYTEDELLRPLGESK